MVFGLYSKGDTAEVLVPIGTGHRFDLVGIPKSLVPGASCSGTLTAEPATAASATDSNVEMRVNGALFSDNKNTKLIASGIADIGPDSNSVTLVGAGPTPDGVYYQCNNVAVGTPPIVAITTAPTLTHDSSVTIAGTCTQGLPVEVSSDGVASSNSTCDASGTFSTTALLGAPLTEGIKHVVARQTDRWNRIGEANQNIVVDLTPPAISFTSPVNNSSVPATFAFTGICEVGTPVSIFDGISTITTGCAAGVFGLSITLTGSDGPVTLTATQSDAAGNSASAPLNVIKTSAGLSIAQFQINGGAAFTNTGLVNVMSTVSGATEKYITNVSGCTSGGSWETYTASKPSWVLGQSNAPATVYGKFRNASLTESSCVSATIVHDNIVPTLGFSATPTINLANKSAYTISGTCSENGRNVVLTGAVGSTTVCTSSSWSMTLDMTALSDGPIVLSISHSDLAGNSFGPLSTTVTKNTSFPTGNNIVIAGGASYTTTSTVNLTLISGGASEMYITNSAGCGSGGTWETMSANKSGWILGQTNTTATVYAKFRNSALNESSCIYSTIVHDSIAPTFTISSPANGSMVDSGNQSNFVVTGSCSESGTIHVTGAVTLTTSCSNPTFSIPFDFSGLGEGSVNLSMHLTDSAGNTSTTLNSYFIKDTTAPSGLSLAIQGGAPAVNSMLVTLTIGATNAYEMYVTNTPGCASGGIWESFSESKTSWQLTTPNTTNTVYIKFRNAALNESACISDSIDHDNIAPTVAIISPVANSYVNAASASSFTISGSCSENGQMVSLSGMTTAQTTCTGGAWSIALDVSAVSDGQITLKADLSDLAGNNATQASRSFLKDTFGPNTTQIHIAGGAGWTNANPVPIDFYAMGATDMYVTNDSTCTTGGTWQSYTTHINSWTLAQTNSVARVYVKYRDSALNESGCLQGSIIHDNIAPTVAISNPAAGSYINFTNQTSFHVDGTCSENGYPVELWFNSVLRGSVPCSAGTWSQNLDLSPVADGAITFEVHQTDVAGNTATPDTRAFVKDVSNPTGASLIMASGAPYTTSTSVSLTLSAIGATEMYVTNDINCMTGGTWESYSTNKSGWTLGQSNTTAWVYVKYRNLAQNESGCVGDSIVHDNVPPIFTTLPTYSSTNASLGASPAIAVNFSATDSTSGIATYQYAIGTAPLGTSMNDVRDWTIVPGATFTATGLSLAGGFDYYVSVRALDNAGNISAPITGAPWNVSVAPNPIPVTNGQVLALERVGHTLFVGGFFSALGDFGGYGTPIAVGTSALAGSLAKINGPVYAAVSDGSTGWYVGGSFTLVGAVGRSNLAHINADGSLDSAFTATANNQVYALAFNPATSTLYAGGNFTTLSGATKTRLGAINVNTSAVTGFADNAVNGPVYALALDTINNDLYFAGSFSSSGGQSRFNIATADPTTGAINTFPPGTAANFNGTIYALALNSGNTVVYVGGSFTNVFGHTGHNSLAAINTAGNGSENAGWQPITNGTVNALITDSSSVYVGGNFTTLNSTSRFYIGQLSAGSGSLMSWNPSADAPVTALAISSSTLFAGGMFTNIGGNPRAGIAGIDTNSGSATGFSPSTGGASINALAVNGSNVYAGSKMSPLLLNSYPRQNLAAIDLRSGTVFQGWNPGANANVRALASDGTNLFVGGNFTVLGGMGRSYLGSVSLSTGVTTSFNPSMNGVVWSIATSAKNLFVGGTFSSAGGGSRNNAACFDLTNTSLTAWNPDVNNTVNAILPNGTNVYLGGAFTSVNSTTRNYLAQVDASSASLTTMNPNLNGSVNVIATNGSYTYVGGAFTLAGGATARNRAAAFDGGGSLTTWDPNVGGSAVYAFAVGTSSMQLGGTFVTLNGGTTRMSVAKTNTSVGTLVSAWNPGAGASGPVIYAIKTAGTNSYIGGQFDMMGGKANANLSVIIDSNGLAP